MGRDSGMQRFDAGFLQRIKDSVNITDIIGSYIPLKKKGNRYWACCPFHHEKTPSFSVSPEKGFYYCFGCHESGDVISFIMKMENLSFADTVERLAEAAHIDMPQEEMTPEERKLQAEREEMYRVAGMAGEYFHNCLVKTHMGHPGLEYMKKRRLSDQTIDHFKLGFAPGEWDRLSRDFTKRGVRRETLLSVGLITRNGEKCYDTFRGRCMFPIMDSKGRIVAFGGRALDDESKPKYLNSPETGIFNKRRLLFAMYQAIPEIRKRKQAIMVEGYMDAISLHAGGIVNAVASLGTAFTAEQARLLKRYADEVVFCYDMDAAGQNATKRAVEIARGAGLKIRIAQLGEGKDPDEFIKLRGREAFEEAIQAAVPIMEYLTASALKQYDITSLEGKQQVLHELLPVLIAQDDPLLIDSHIRRMSRVLRLDEGLIRSEAVRYAASRHSNVYISVKSQDTGGRMSSTESEKTVQLEGGVLRSCMERHRFPDGWDQLKEYHFVVPFHQHLYDILTEIGTRGEELSQTAVEARLEQGEISQLAALLMKEEHTPVSPLEAYIKPLRLEVLRQEYREHSARADRLSQEDPDGYQQEMIRCIRINQQIRTLTGKN